MGPAFSEHSMLADNSMLTPVALDATLGIQNHSQRMGRTIMEVIEQVIQPHELQHPLMFNKVPQFLEGNEVLYEVSGEWLQEALC